MSLAFNKNINFIQIYSVIRRVWCLYSDGDWGCVLLGGFEVCIMAARLSQYDSRAAPTNSSILPYNSSILAQQLNSQE